MSDEYISEGEFGRFRQDFSDFREQIHDEIANGFSGINARLDALNGRVRTNTANISGLQATCDERGKSCGRGGVIVSWKVASVIALAVLVLGALLGPETVKAAVGILK